MQDNAIVGHKQQYPFPILSSDNMGRQYQLIINEEKELWELIDNALLDSSNQKKKMKLILYEIGIRDTIMLLDIRTSQILEWYNIFKNNVTIINNDFWLWSVGQLNKLEPRLF